MGISDVNFWLRSAKIHVRPNLPIFRARHLENLIGNQMAGQSVNAHTIFLSNTVLCAINVHTTKLDRVTTFSVGAAIMSFIFAMVGLRGAWIWMKGMRANIRRLEIRIQTGDIQNSVVDLYSLKNAPTIRAFSWV